MFALRPRKIAAALVALFLAVFPLASLATTLNGRSAIFSREQVSATTNVEVHFTTPTGVDDPSDTITVTFPSGYNLSTIVAGDVDLYHGTPTGFETSETVAASAAAGVWGASVTGQVLTLSAPTDAALGEIAANDLVVIRVGTNASGGTHQITNPSSAGTATISIGGTFGDVGGMDVILVSADSISVSATVNAAATTVNPGGGPGGGVDGTPPTLINVHVINITTTSADVVWQTDENATSFVEYGLDTSYTAGSQSDNTLVTSHSLPLTGLQPGTLYHLRVRSADAVNNVAQSGDVTFTTSVPPHAPVISNIRVVNITGTGAVVLWDTDIAASSIVDFGTTVAYGSNASTGGFTQAHSVALGGLSPNTLYHFRVTSADSTGLTSVSGDNQFSTLGDTTPPANVFNFQAAAGNQLNTLSWTNPGDLDFSFVRILARTDHYPVDANDGRLVYQGNASNVVDTGLTNGTTYYYGNFAFDSNGNRASGAFASATPSGVPLPPQPPQPPLPPPGVEEQPPVQPPVLPPQPPQPEVPPVPGVIAPAIQALFFGQNGAIQLQADALGQVGAVVGQPIQVQIPVAGLGSMPASGQIRVGDSMYALAPLPSGNAWAATFVPSYQIESVPTVVTFQFSNGTQASIRNDLLTQGVGQVTEVDVSGLQHPSEGAEVRLNVFRGGNYVNWDGSASGQINPVTTGKDGSFYFIVPNGSYQISVRKSGFLTEQRNIEVHRNVVAQNVTLRLVPANPVEAIVTLSKEPEAQQAAQIAAPVTLIVALGNLTTAASFFNILNYVWFLLTQPILLLGRRKRKNWGIVYNGFTKRPIELAVVRLIDAQRRLIIQTRITDKDGRYFFNAKPGQYRIEVTKAGYLFPSEYLRKEKEDLEKLDVYHGEIIAVKDDVALGVNIPLDPLVKTESPRSIFFRKSLRVFQHAFSLFSLVFSLILLIISPTWASLLMVGLQIAAYALFRRLALPLKPKKWGIVHDAKTRKPLGNAVVRLFDARFNKLLESQVTDSSGKYGFFVGNNVFYVTADHGGYETYKSEQLDLTKAKELAVRKEILLQRKP